MKMIKKWIISAFAAITGLLLLAIAAKLCGELDVYHISQPGPHGQFTGTDREVLIWIFLELFCKSIEVEMRLSHE